VARATSNRPCPSTMPVIIAFADFPVPKHSKPKHSPAVPNPNQAETLRVIKQGYPLQTNKKSHPQSIEATVDIDSPSHSPPQYATSPRPLRALSERAMPFRDTCSDAGRVQKVQCFCSYMFVSGILRPVYSEGPSYMLDDALLCCFVVQIVYVAVSPKDS